MKIDVSVRGGGKTTRMLEWMRAAPEGEHRVIVCATQDEAMRLLRENRDLESWQFISIRELVEDSDYAWSGVLVGRGGRIVLGLDNLDLMLHYLARRWSIGAVSMSEETP